MNENIQTKLAVEIANKSIIIAILEAQNEELQAQLARVNNVLESDEALKELFDEVANKEGK
nr:MAG TPA: protein of unknown function (DUF5320) [Caudoviricetes sp.]